MIPVVTQTLIIINVAVFLVQQGTGEQLVVPFALWPIGSEFRIWQPVTYAFLHGSLAHIFFNMFGLFIFGSDIERLWGPRRFLIYYIACVLTAAMAQLTVSNLMGQDAPAVGASGGVFGVLLAFGLLFPRRTVILLIPPIPMPAWLFVILYGALELVLGVTGTQTGVAHFAHLGGMLGGFLLLIYWGWGRRWR